jgi:hypothetical protein
MRASWRPVRIVPGLNGADPDTVLNALARQSLSEVVRGPIDRAANQTLGCRRTARQAGDKDHGSLRRPQGRPGRTDQPQMAKELGVEVVLPDLIA